MDIKTKIKNIIKFIFYVGKCADENHYPIRTVTILGKQFKSLYIDKLTILDNNFVEKPKVFLSVVAIAQNEASYIKEWIEYHKLVGVERFYFYDNGSTDNTREVLEPYINDGTVVYDYCEGKCLQYKAYTDAVLKYKNQTEWLAIIDLDEYIVPIEKNSIPDFLKEFEGAPAVGINWVMFDSNGHKTKPTENDGLITANYTRVQKNYDTKVNRHIKSIVNPRKVITVQNPHFAIYKNNEFALNENHEKICGPFTKKHSSTKIQINHYYTKSAEEYRKKTDRGNADNTNPRVYYEDSVNFVDATNDYAIQKYLPELRKRLRLDKED